MPTGVQWCRSERLRVLLNHCVLFPGSVLGEEGRRSRAPVATLPC